MASKTTDSPSAAPRATEAGQASQAGPRQAGPRQAGPREAAPRQAGPQPATPRLAADRIRETARRMFYRDGIRAVGVDAIVNEAGVTKPSLYRAFSSKDELAASYLRDYEQEFWARFDAGLDTHPDDPREQVLAYFRVLSQRATELPNYRGCGLSNACVEYPEPDHPAREVAVAHKHVLRDRMVELARAMGAQDPDELGNGLLLMLEGAFLTGQMFGEDGPPKYLVAAAERLIDASLR
ncbi:TetR/AcrR family transcriptional regulator [Bordetella genomosp. 5]|uniref:TetR family transcriptional regulator n=1 Tax=Bordetella genomosp. 5 TaxID=1395608 RepID=A0A261TF00_9BORD|nr:TetR/AcrR family transcriptional regulator [Bordetella genomosp. 5]OZI47995.1 TetR family transcriptional regulator [Bordetella genomosp. 5]